MNPADAAAKMPTHYAPGEALRRLFMEPLGLSAYRLSSDLGVAPIAISQVLRGKRAISPSMALKLGIYFGVEPGFWMALQAAHDLQVAAIASTAEGAEGSMQAVKRCPALAGRSLLVRESKTNGTRQWEVLMVSSKEAEAPRADGQGPSKRTPKGKPDTHRSAGKRKPKAGSRK